MAGKEAHITNKPTGTLVLYNSAGDKFYVAKCNADGVLLTKGEIDATIDFEVDPGIESAFQQMPGSAIKTPEININPDYNPFSNKKESSAEGFKPQPETGDKHWQKIFEGHREVVNPETNNTIIPFCEKW